MPRSSVSRSSARRVRPVNPVQSAGTVRILSGHARMSTGLFGRCPAWLDSVDDRMLWASMSMTLGSSAREKNAISRGGSYFRRTRTKHTPFIYKAIALKKQPSQAFSPTCGPGRVGAPGRVAPARRPAPDGRGGAEVPVLGGRRPGGGRAVARRHGDDRGRRRRRLRPASATSWPRGGPPRRAAARGRGAHAAALARGRRDALDAPVMMMLYPWSRLPHE